MDCVTVSYAGVAVLAPLKRSRKLCLFHSNVKILIAICHEKITPHSSKLSLSAILIQHKKKSSSLWTYFWKPLIGYKSKKACVEKCSEKFLVNPRPPILIYFILQIKVLKFGNDWKIIFHFIYIFSRDSQYH